MAYTHLTKEALFKIQSWKEIGMCQMEMARRIGTDPSTISRELGRNSYPGGRYHAGHAQTLRQNRRKSGKRRTKKLLRDQPLQQAIIERLQDKDSPEQIVGKRRRLGLPFVVHETIYQFLYTERPDLVCLLRQKKGKYRRRHGTKQREKEREWAKKTWITARPMIIAQRQELGHWEGDTIHGKEKTIGIATHVERVSGYGLADKLDQITARAMSETTIRRFAALPYHQRRSETDDNGSEFADHEETASRLGMHIYFALPYHSWERGTNENWNGLLRQFFPKGMAFATITQRDVDRAVHNLNNRPRKRLNYLTPNEVFVKGMTP